MATEIAPRDLTIEGFGGVRLHALDWGGRADGTPVVLLHGVGGNAWIWNPLGQRLHAALGDDFHVVGLDQRGGGDSDKPATGYLANDFAQDVIAAHDALGGKPMVLVGHSRGGWLAAYIAGRWPERVQTLVLVDPARIAFDSVADADAFYGPVREQLGPWPSRQAAVEFGRSRDREAIWNADRERSFLFGFDEQPDGSLVGKMPHRVLDQMRTAREDADVGAAGQQFERISMPTLLFVATKANERRQQQKRAYAERIPQTRTVDLYGSHHLQVEFPDEMAREIVGFVREGAAG
jgi:pimeloyl-ACP methyl ester carboxylesterase